MTLRIEKLEDRTYLSVNVAPLTIAEETGHVAEIHPHSDGAIVISIKAGDGILGRDSELRVWKSDGTTEGTTQVSDFASDEIRHSIVTESAAYITGGFSGNEFRRVRLSDGQVTHLANGPNGFAESPTLSRLGETVVYRHQRELWKVDALASEGEMVRDFLDPVGNREFFGVEPGPLVPVDDVVYFSGNDGLEGRELWKSDGTEAGTVIVANLTPGFQDGTVFQGFASSGDALYFKTGFFPMELWRTDGTEGGTVLVADHGTDSTPLMPLKGGVVWKSNIEKTLNYQRDDAEPLALHRIEGARLIRDFLETNDRLFILMRNLDNRGRTEIWTSDGTPNGTRLAVTMPDDFELDDRERKIAFIGNTLFFVGSDGTNGCALYQSDGTETGTGLAYDFHPDEDRRLDQCPRKLTTSNDQIFLEADDFFNGFRVYSVRPAALERSPGDSNLDGAFNSSDLVHVFQRGKYETEEEATWEEGDWNGDGRFTTADLVAAFQAGSYSANALAQRVDSVFELGNEQRIEPIIVGKSKLEWLDLKVDEFGSRLAERLP